MSLAETINECFHAFGVHSVTLQPEVAPHIMSVPEGHAGPVESLASLRERKRIVDNCEVGCMANNCEELSRAA